MHIQVVLHAVCFYYQELVLKLKHVLGCNAVMRPCFAAEFSKAVRVASGVDLPKNVVSLIVLAFGRTTGKHWLTRFAFLDSNSGRVCL